MRIQFSLLALLSLFLCAAGPVDVGGGEGPDCGAYKIGVQNAQQNLATAQIVLANATNVKTAANLALQKGEDDLVVANRERIEAEADVLAALKTLNPAAMAIAEAVLIAADANFVSATNALGPLNAAANAAQTAWQAASKNVADAQKALSDAQAALKKCESGK